MATRGIKSKYVVKNRHKYIGKNIDSIILRSSWESLYIRHLDYSKSILEFSSECVIIPYICPTDGKRHKYYMDFFVKSIDAEGNISRSLVEIKPNKERSRPRNNKNKKRHLTETMTYVKNQAKWAAAELYAHTRGWNFYVLDEYSLGIKKKK